MKHTPEPWPVYVKLTDSSDNLRECLHVMQFNYKRARACVNALSVIEDVELFMNETEKFVRRMDCLCPGVKDLICHRCNVLDFFSTNKEK